MLAIAFNMHKAIKVQQTKVNTLALKTKCFNLEALEGTLFQNKKTQNVFNQALNTQDWLYMILIATRSRIIHTYRDALIAREGM